MSESDFEFDILTQKNLLESLLSCLPIGSNKHFAMISCLAKFNSLQKKDHSSEIIWKFLDSLYDPKELDRIANSEFPNHHEDFDLSKHKDFKDLIKTGNESTNETSDDNTISGASTPIHVSAQALVAKERKRKSNVSMEKTPSGLGRRKERSDSDKTEKSEIKHHNQRNPNENNFSLNIRENFNKLCKPNQGSSNKDHHSTPQSSSSSSIQRGRKRSRGSSKSNQRESIVTSPNKSLSSSKKPRIRREVD